MSRWFLTKQEKTVRANPLELSGGIQSLGNVVAGFFESANTRRQKITRSTGSGYHHISFFGVQGRFFQS
jgi:hypothetical protein